MNDNGVNPEIMSRLGFLHSTLSISHFVLNEWLRIPAFVDSVDEMIACKVPVCNSEVLKAMETIFARDFEPITDQGLRNEVHFNTLKRGINQLRRAVDEK